MSKSKGWFRHTDPTNSDLERVGWFGPLTVDVIKQFRSRVGDVPAPFSVARRSGVAPREMIAAQLDGRSNEDFIGPVSLRHFRRMSDWLRPTTWPLLSEVHEGRILNLYHQHFVVIPSQSVPDQQTAETLWKFAVYYNQSWTHWCSVADKLGFIGMDTNEGFPPYLVVFGRDASDGLIQDKAIAEAGPPPDWCLSLR